MKKILSIGASVMLAVSAFATGNEGVNPPQSGVVLFTPAGLLVITNAFAYPFQVAPVATIFGSSTNSLSYTTTTTNIVITSAGGTGATNYSVAWNAFVGGTRIESGSQIISTGTTNITFPNAYAIAPQVFIGSGLTGTNAAVATTVTTTNFTLNCAGTSTNSWLSIGTVYNPPSENVGANPPSNKIVY